MQQIQIQKTRAKSDNMVLVDRRDFELFQNWQKEVNDALTKIRRGCKEYLTGKTITAPSPNVFRET